MKPPSCVGWGVKIFGENADTMFEKDKIGESGTYSLKNCIYVELCLSSEI